MELFSPAHNPRVSDGYGQKEIHGICVPVHSAMVHLAAIAVNYFYQLRTLLVLNMVMVAIVFFPQLLELSLRDIASTAKDG